MDEPRLLRAIRAAAVDYHVKPFDPEELLIRLRREAQAIRK